MTNDSVIEEAAKEAIWRTSPDFDGEANLIAALDKMLAVFEKAHNPTDDERAVMDDMADLIRDKVYDPWNNTPEAIAEALTAAGFRRSEVPEPQGEPTEYLDHYADPNDPFWQSRPEPVTQGEPSDAQALELDPQPWVFVSDQVFGVRSATDKGFHSVSGAYYVFQPRSGYEQDRARYEDQTTVHEIRRQSNG